MRRIVIVNLALVGLQAVSAGFLMSGYDYAAAAHQAVAVLLLLGFFIQAVTAIVLWRRRRLPAQVAGASIGLLVFLLVQVWAGRNREYWLHVPVGVGLVSGLTRQKSLLE